MIDLQRLFEMITHLLHTNKTDLSLKQYVP